MPVTNEPWHFGNGLSASSLQLPNAGLSALQAVHQFPVHYSQAGGANVASESRPVHICKEAATVAAIEVATVTAPTGGDKQFTVDVQKGNQASTFATILSSVVTIDSSKSDRQVVVATLASSALADGDTLRVVVTASGSTGSQAQGLIVTITLRENPGTS